MTHDVLFVIYVLGAVLSGLILGRIWGRRLPEPKDRRRPVETLEARHQIRALNSVARGDVDEAIEELTRAARINSDAVEVYSVLGKLFRRKGQLERAIHVHKSILHRPGLSRDDRVEALTDLARDFSRAGLVGRAKEAIKKALEDDPHNLEAMGEQQKIFEQAREWEEALEIQQRLAKRSGNTDMRVSAFLRAESGRKKLEEGDIKGARQRFKDALDIDRGTGSAHVALGETYFRERKFGKAISIWEDFVREFPERSHLVLDLMQEACLAEGNLERLVALCEDRAAKDALDWRVRLKLSELYEGMGRRSRALEMLSEAVKAQPRAIFVHRKVWEFFERRGVESEEIREYLSCIPENGLRDDLNICKSCGYKTSDFLWRCPHCLGWDVFQPSASL